MSIVRIGSLSKHPLIANPTFDAAVDCIVVCRSEDRRRYSWVCKQVLSSSNSFKLFRVNRLLKLDWSSERGRSITNQLIRRLRIETSIINTLLQQQA
jgi:hypothetical protein